ncbi:hypothetical protein P389DRAFT_100129 [Cystobasidium minutum MCA 4210]|uniref:uncharacterized protein n=1 Tax=Cystobasidium minutum MCA 4210 TaxID=1397322 RepID=UPI0034CD4753|eukprot:jgi/Rhomi1/100129/CE100128_11706
MFSSPTRTLIPRLSRNLRAAQRLPASQALIASRHNPALGGANYARQFSSSKMTESTNNPDGKKVPKPSDAPSEGRKPIPDTGWEGEVPSHKGGDYEKDFLNKPPYKWTSDKFIPKYKASCWCGNLEFEYAGDPWDAKFCHCHDCQRLHGAPFQHAVIFPKTSVRMTKCEGQGSSKKDSIDFFSSDKRTSVHNVPCKVACDNCRSPLFDEGRNTVLCYPSSFDFGPDEHMPDDFKAKCHIFYGSRSMDIIDGLPKWSGHKDTSELLPEVAQSTK